MRLSAAVLLAGILTLAGCSAGSLGSSSDANGKTEITFLTNNDPANVKVAEAVIKAFEAKDSSVHVKLDTRPQGSEGDNLIKTRLATGDMADVFEYNSGSLFQAIAPQANLTPVTGAAWAGDLDPTFKQVVSVNNEVYGSPWGGANGGGMFYNKPLYAKLGLQIPRTWDQFMANNAKIKAAGVAPVEQTYSETWTSQVLVLADYHNVATANPDFATRYTNNQAKFATTPAALAGFRHLEQLKKAGYWNADYASAKYNEGLAAVATGKAGHYPMITFGIPALTTAAPDNIDDVGFFAMPGTDESKNGVTLWEPSGIYIPKSTKDARLEAAKKFQAFVASPEGCAANASAAAVGGPFVVKTCKLPDTVAPAVKDLAAYVDAGAVTPALEFLSPIKGPALEQITVEVGSGIRGADAGAELYDEDVKKQAQQLGLQGW
ncbi:ABC transporter substrate-binding protein [Actinoplanes sp. NPDC020271]|uniref:ABC transporter substrate-binding protein n=1 Tax=Actinoplanes sp. NPDC020271 TaxID=3363896 RepID=UPI00379CB3BE